MSEQLTSVYKATTPPFPVAMVANTMIMSMQDSIGLDDHYEVFYDVITDKVNDWYFRQRDIDRVARGVVTILAKNPYVVEHCREQYVAHMTRVLELLNRDTLSVRLPKMSKSELASLLHDAAPAYRLASSFVEPPNFSLEVGGNDLIKQKFKDYFAEKEIALSGSEFEDYFSSLINFTQMSFVQKEEVALLSIVLLPEAQRPEAISAHAQAYYWKSYDYFGPILDAATIAEELKPLLTLSREEIQARIAGHHKAVKEAEEKRKKNLARYELPQELINLVEASSAFAYAYSDVKKQYTSQANVGFGEILKFLGKKYNIDDFLLHYATFEELVDLAGEGKVLEAAMLEGRVASSVAKLYSPQRYYEFLGEKGAAEIRQRVGKMDQAPVTQLRGMPATGGKYTGPARVVVNVSRISQVQEGDVLVAPMTTVGYVPAMKKAGAIITDIGGITSHAAIVSRELGVPCIVGLRTATSSFHDGDILEVNANHGLVKLLEKKV